MKFNEKLEELNKKLSSSITQRTAIDEMYSKGCIEFLNEKGEVFFKAMASEPVLINAPFEVQMKNIETVEEIHKKHDEDWELNTICSLEHRYIELYRKD